MNRLTTALIGLVLGGAMVGAITRTRAAESAASPGAAGGRDVARSSNLSDEDRNFIRSEIALAIDSALERAVPGIATTGAARGPVVQPQGPDQAPPKTEAQLRAQETIDRLVAEAKSRREWRRDEAERFQAALHDLAPEDRLEAMKSLSHSINAHEVVLTYPGLPF